jgi:tetratricopeptide (TPR) repeat protein
VQREPANTDARLELGKALFEAGDVQEAIQQTKAILDGQPDYADALYNLGAIYGNLGQADLARQYWNRLIANRPQTESATVACAKCHVPAGPATKYRIQFGQCTDCHADKHQNQFAGAPHANRCDDCVAFRARLSFQLRSRHATP